MQRKPHQALGRKTRRASDGSDVSDRSAPAAMELVYECSQVQHYLLGSHWWPVGATFLPARAGGEEAPTVLRLFLIPPQSHLIIRFSRLTRTISRIPLTGGPAGARAVVLRERPEAEPTLSCSQRPSVVDQTDMAAVADTCRADAAAPNISHASV